MQNPAVRILLVMNEPNPKNEPNPNLHLPSNHSMLRRCQNWDYKGRGIYMLTFIVDDRRPLLGILQGTEKQASIEPTPIGRAVEEELLHMADDFRQLEILKYQLMPDHLHVVLFVHDELPMHLGRIVARFKAACLHRYWEILGLRTNDSLINQREQNQGNLEARAGGSALPCGESVTGGSALPCGESVIGSSTLTCGESLPVGSVPADLSAGAVGSALPCSESVTDGSALSCGESLAVGSVPADLSAGKETSVKPALFEKGYHDRILFHNGQLDNMIRYVENNPLRLMQKRLHKDLFTIRHNLQVGNMTFDAIGNIFLLDYPLKLQVQCSRRLTDQQIQTESDAYLGEGGLGAVLVSPCISSGEKTVAKAALEAQVPLIVLLENGFAPLYKPTGRYFEACVAGKLLMLAPWNYHSDKRQITREQCLALNDMAQQIAQL